MAIRINENIFSLLANRSLVRASESLEGAYRRLSSGERITRSGDDPTGMANSNLLRAKINGLQRNLMNCNEGLNLLGVSESALGSVTEVLQRLRELAVQASSDTVSDSQRILIQNEVDQLLDEIQRVATTTNYNDKNLLDGTFTGMRLQVGTRQGEVIPVSIEDVRTSILGSIARAAGTQQVSGAAITGAGDLTINSYNVPASLFDGVSTVEGDASAIAKAEAINSVTFQTKVTAKVGPAIHSEGGAAVGAGSLDGGANSLLINGVNIGALDFAAGDADGILRDMINGFKGLTGVEAEIGVNGQLVLTAEDGRNVHIQTTGSVGDELGLRVGDGDVDTVVRGTITLASSETIQLGPAPLAQPLALIGFSGGQATTFIDSATAIRYLRVTTTDDSQLALETIDEALRQVLSRRASLGAIESRVNNTIDDLMIQIESLSAANSRIRDADLAVETSKLAQAQIIQQAGISILAQANVIPQMALRLLER